MNVNAKPPESSSDRAQSVPNQPTAASPHRRRVLRARTRRDEQLRDIRRVCFLVAIPAVDQTVSRKSIEDVKKRTNREKLDLIVAQQRAEAELKRPFQPERLKWARD